MKKILSILLIITSFNAFSQATVEDLRNHTFKMKPFSIRGSARETDLKEISIDTLLKATDNQITIEKLRLLSGFTPFNSYLITDVGKEGFFKYDATDISTADNLGTVLVDASGRRWKRFFDYSVSVKWFGAVGDGINNDTEPIQNTLKFVSDLPNKKLIKIPSGSYSIETIYIPFGVEIEGESFNMPSNVYATVLKQRSNNDVIRFIGYFSNGNYKYFGKISKLTIEGKAGSTLGNGINSLDSKGNAILFQDTCFMEDIVIRNMPENGLYIRAAFPASFNKIVCLFNNLAGIKIVRLGNIQGLELSNISGDGNEFLIDVINLKVNDNIIINNLKSEYRINTLFGKGARQARPIVFRKSNGGVVHINGASHISSVTNSNGDYVKPSDLVLITESIVHPTINWDGVNIEIKPLAVGADPYIINSGTALELNANYTVHSGKFNGVSYNILSPIIQLRTNNTSNLPVLDVTKSNTILLNYSVSTILTTLIGYESQIVTLLFSNDNVIIHGGGNFALTNTYQSTPNSSLTLINIGGIWREINRMNSTTGKATLLNGTVIVSSNKITRNSTIFLTRNTPKGVVGHLSAPSSSIIPGKSFVINSSSNTEHSTIYWEIKN